MDFKTHKTQLMKDPEFRKTYEESQVEYEIARALIKARIEKGYTQQQLAEKLNTKQSVISRVESGTALPSLSLLKRLAEALNTTLQVHFK